MQYCLKFDLIEAHLLQGSFTFIFGHFLPEINMTLLLPPDGLLSSLEHKCWRLLQLFFLDFLEGVGLQSAPSQILTRCLSRWFHLILSLSITQSPILLNIVQNKCFLPPQIVTRILHSAEPHLKQQELILVFYSLQSLNPQQYGRFSPPSYT